uniref:Uncharacterized protein n=1 Tax=Oryza punctata TaxID=4537 RepID=A0A0E0LRY6_ORYPU
MVFLGGKIIATGCAIAFFAVGAGISFGSHGLVLILLGVLAGVTLVAVGVWTTDCSPAAFSCSATLHGISLLVAMALRRNIAVVGLVMASSAITAAAGEASPALYFSLLATLLVGVSLIAAGVLGS